MWGPAVLGVCIVLCLPVLNLFKIPLQIKVIRPVAARKQFTTFKTTYPHLFLWIRPQQYPQSECGCSGSFAGHLRGRALTTEQSRSALSELTQTVPIISEVLEKTCREECWKGWWLCTVKLILPDLDLDPSEWDTAQIHNKEGFLSLRSSSADCKTKDRITSRQVLKKWGDTNEIPGNRK